MVKHQEEKVEVGAGRCRYTRQRLLDITAMQLVSCALLLFSESQAHGALEQAVGGNPAADPSGSQDQSNRLGAGGGRLVLGRLSATPENVVDEGYQGC